MKKQKKSPGNVCEKNRNQLIEHLKAVLESYVED